MSSLDLGDYYSSRLKIKECVNLDKGGCIDWGAEKDKKVIIFSLMVCEDLLRKFTFYHVSFVTYHHLCIITVEILSCNSRDSHSHIRYLTALSSTNSYEIPTWIVMS